MDIFVMFNDWLAHKFPASSEVIDEFFIETNLNPDLDVRKFPRWERYAIISHDAASKCGFPDDDPRPMGKRVY